LLTYRPILSGMTHAPLPSAPSAIDVELAPADYDEISRTVAEVSGIQLRSGKQGLVRSRLARRLRQLGLLSYEAYLVRTRGPAGAAERAHMVDLLTTNKTSFFREPAHFDLLRARVLPEFGGATGGLRVWSAGCSSGEEPYTLAMVLADTLAEPARRAARILATDLSARVLERAVAGVYTDEQTEGVPPELLRRHFTRAAVAPGGPTWSAGTGLRSLVSFAPLNLMTAWPMRGPFHAIFCRNVMIYFDKATQATLVRRFHDLLAPGGYLFIGHSESLSGVEHAYAYVQPAVYRT
jgi:chemotaxis protein methyltransferase CheR